MNSSIITFWDWLLAPFYLIIIVVVAARIKNKAIQMDPIYRYFLWGLYAKIVGAVSLCLIYVYYYKEGGDTLNYNYDSSVLLKLFFRSASDFFEVWVFPLSKESMTNIPAEIGYIIYGRDSNAFMVDRLLVPIKFICFDSYMVSSMLMAVISFSGVWKLYKVFCDYYPHLYKQFAITVLFVPSVVFWGSGMLKDSWTLAAVGWYTYSFYKVFIKRESRTYAAITLTISALIMITIKPYIFVGLLPGTFLWMISSRLGRIKSIFFKIMAGPFVAGIGLGLGLLIWTLASSSLGQYSTINGMLKKAADASYDLKQEYYQGNSFDIGTINPTIAGVISKFPIATTTGLFRPFLWEARNTVMIVSGLENAVILFFVLYVILRNPVTVFKEMGVNPLVSFCLIFAIFFAFAVAISTSNFGAMVRLRIPQMPFLLSVLVILHFKGKRARLLE